MLPSPGTLVKYGKWIYIDQCDSCHPHQQKSSINNAVDQPARLEVHVSHKVEIVHRQSPMVIHLSWSSSEGGWSSSEGGWSSTRSFTRRQGPTCGRRWVPWVRHLWTSRLRRRASNIKSQIPNKGQDAEKSSPMTKNDFANGPPYSLLKVTLR